MDINNKPFAALRDLIVARYQTFDKFATAMGFTRVTLSYKLTGKTQWRQKDIIKACELLNIKDNEIYHYFLQ